MPGDERDRQQMSGQGEQNSAGASERDRFLAMVAHELRSPITAIALALEVSSGDSIAPELLSTIRRQVELLRRLVDDLFDISRFTTGKIALVRERVDLDAVVRSTVADMSAHAQTRGIAIRLHAPQHGPAVQGDRVRLEQIIQNLLTNAIKYTPDSGRIDVFVTDDGDQAVVRVCDTGIGIRSEDLDRIFDWFTQADPAHSQAGLGIGLALVRNLVALHGGTVRALSEGPGKGAEFVVRLPKAPARERELPVEPIAVPATAAPCTIVVVDDNDDIRALFALWLQRLGHRVETASTGAAAVELIARLRPALAFIDILLPDLDGYEVARRVRQRVGADVALVALTGFSLPEDQEKARAAGFDRLLTKPLQRTEIDGCIRSAVRAPAGQAEKRPPSTATPPAFRIAP